MTHGSLFSGIGGFELAAEWAGWENVFQVEWNPFCQKILKKNFPDANLFGDIREFDGLPWRGSVDVISGGFPCQPYSSAGKRLGKEDERHLWPEMLRIIRDVAPRWVVGENVRGLVNWSGGLVFDEVQADLEASGYEVQPFLLPAASVNAPHRRDRVWFVAYRAGEQMGDAGQPRQRGGVECAAADAEHLQSINGHQSNMQRRRPEDAEQIRMGGKPTTANPNNQRREKQHTSEKPGYPGQPGWGMFTQWDKWPTQPPVCGRNDGVSNRVDRIAALGNAVVPQLVWRIFDTINHFEHGKQ